MMVFGAGQCERANRRAEYQFLFVLSICRIITRYSTNSPTKNKQNRVQWWASSVEISASGNDKNASALGRPTRDVTNIGGGSGRSGDQFRRVVLGEFRSEVGGEGKPVVEQGRRTLLLTWSLAPKQKDGS
jgi:hypothetical protein